MSGIISIRKVLKEIIDEKLNENSKANIAVIGSSTLGRDHSLLFFSSILADTDANLLVLDHPMDMENHSYGSIDHIEQEMNFMSGRYKLKNPEYVECDIKTLDKTFDPETFDIIYDHHTLPWVVSPTTNFDEIISFEEGVSKIIGLYVQTLKKNGKLLIAKSSSHFSISPSYKLEQVKKSLANLEVPYYEINIKEMDLRKKFPELREMGNQAGITIKRPVQYPCNKMIIGTKS